MAKGDFENRDRDEIADVAGVPLLGDTSLGELSDDLSLERGDLDSYNVDPGAIEQPDMAAAAQDAADAKLTGLGSPKLDFTVRSVFDSRPTLSKDFNLWFAVDWPSAPDFTIYDSLEQAFFVPAGYVAVVRRVELVAEQDASNMQPYDGWLEVMADNAVRDPIDVPDGPAASSGSLPSQIPGIVFTLPARIDTFILVDERLSVGARITFNTSFDRPFLAVGFHGTFLLKTGVPAIFQAANEAVRARSASTTPQGEILSGADLMRRKRRRVMFPDVPIVNAPPRRGR